MVDEGRIRSTSIASLVPGDDIELLYGESHEGIGYCAFSYKDDYYDKCAVTVRTSSNNYIKIDENLLIGNEDRCREHEHKHHLILAFNWGSDSSIYLIKDGFIKNCVSGVTPARKYLVFRKSLLDYKIGFNSGIRKLK